MSVLHVSSFVHNEWVTCFKDVFISDVLASQDQSGGDATVTIDQRKCFNKN